MNLTIKLLKQHGEIFAPLTTAEAVLVKDGSEIITLDNMLSRKLERIITPANSGLTAYPLGSNIILTHSNSIEATDTPKPLQILYDNRGHVIAAIPLNKNKIIVDTEPYYEYDGSVDLIMQLGDDFGIDSGKIILKWNYI